MSKWKLNNGDVIDTSRALTVQNISQGWQFKQEDAEEWLPVARVPTNVHLDLIDNGMSVALTFARNQNH